VFLCICVCVSSCSCFFLLECECECESENGREYVVRRGQVWQAEAASAEAGWGVDLVAARATERSSQAEYAAALRAQMQAKTGER